MSMITATTWVRRGVAAPFPERYEIDEAEINRISELAKIQLEGAKTDLKQAQHQSSKDQREGEGEGEEEEEEESEDDSAEPSGEGKGRAKGYVFLSPEEVV